MLGSLNIVLFKIIDWNLLFNVGNNLLKNLTYGLVSQSFRVSLKSDVIQKYSQMLGCWIVGQLALVCDAQDVTQLVVPISGSINLMMLN